MSNTAQQLNRRAPRRLWHRSFTLVEVMIVVVIIGLVAGLVGPAVFGQFEKAKQKSTKTQLLGLGGCVDSFYLDVGEYPQRLDDLIKSNGSAKWRGPYVKNGLLPKDGWGNEFIYEVPGHDGRSYEIYSYGKDNAPGGNDLNTDILIDTEI